MFPWMILKFFNFVVPCIYYFSWLFPRPTPRCLPCWVAFLLLLATSQLWLQILVAFRNESPQQKEDPLPLSKPCTCLLMTYQILPLPPLLPISMQPPCCLDRYFWNQICTKQIASVIFSCWWTLSVVFTADFWAWNLSCCWSLRLNVPNAFSSYSRTRTLWHCSWCTKGPPELQESSRHYCHSWNGWAQRRW